MNPFRNRKPILAPTAFFGRSVQVATIGQQLAAQPPQCCAVVGLPRSGKTSLLYHLQQQAHLPVPQRQLSFGDKQQVLAVYVNAGPYSDLDGNHPEGALYFWRDLYRALAQELTASGVQPLPPDPGHSDLPVLEQLQTLWHSMADAIRNATADLVLLLIDNAEGIARLPRVTGSLLRTLTQDPTLGERVAFVATSSRPLHEFYEPNTWQASSSFWNLFAGTVYLGQLEPAAAQALMTRSPTAENAVRFSAQEQTLLLRLAGRHPDLLTMACALLYEHHVALPRTTVNAQALEQQLFDTALPLCQAIWQALGQITGAQTLVQRVAGGGLAVAGEPPPLLTTLTRLGVVEQDGVRWRLFATVMQRFVQQTSALATPGVAAELTSNHASTPPTPEPVTAHPNHALPGPAFTHLEGALYAFLTAHAGVVCDRESIKRALWTDDAPSDSALQKLIERIREKIEVDPKQPRRLLAVRGQGYVLYPESAA
ncbi:MAG: transcriptional regulator [Caldilinea sp. CFX5]|nr:transcriptional regulator [Caldilinea sp. CFX5]